MGDMENANLLVSILGHTHIGSEKLSTTELEYALGACVSLFHVGLCSGCV